MSLQVIETTTRGNLHKFMELSRQIYKDDPFCFLPSMDNNLSEILQNPYFRQRSKLFLALRNNQPVARVAAITDQAYREEIGFFGYFEAFEDTEATGKLFHTAINWLKNCNKTTVIGPVTRNTNQLIGVLTEGFAEEPYFMTPYNPPYYSPLLNNLGFDKMEDFYAYRWHQGITVSEKIKKVVQRAERISGLKIRSIDFNQLNRETTIVRSILNQSMSDNWGYKPLSEIETYQILYGYRGFCDPDLMTVIEINRQPAAICLAVPNINPLLRQYPNGLPLPLPQLLRKKMKTSRLAILGVVPRFRCRGLEALMMLRTINIAIAKGYTSAELSLIHEKNTMMNKIISEAGCPRVKSFRLYQKDI